MLFNTFKIMAQKTIDHLRSEIHDTLLHHRVEAYAEQQPQNPFENNLYATL
jgi:hypothetical protein